MKTRLLLLLAMLFAAFAFVSCEDNIQEEFPDDSQTEQDGGDGSSDKETPSVPEEPSIPDTNKIFYTTNDGQTVDVSFEENIFGMGVKILSNVYENGKGVITFNRTVTSVGEDAFLYCENLTGITIPDSVVSIGYRAFCVCSSLTSITIPDNVTSIDYYAFVGCESLEAFYGKFASDDNRCLIVDGILKSFAPAGLTSYTIPDGVIEIGQNVFRACSDLTSVTIPEGVVKIGERAFYICINLININIPSSVTEIGEYAFKYDYYYDISADGYVDYKYRSYDCRVDITDLTAWCKIDFWDYYSNPLSSGILYLDGVLLTDAKIPDSITSIKNYTFAYCDSLTNVAIPECVTSIGYCAFSYCRDLTSVTIGNRVTSIGNSAFSHCSSLTSISIPDSVTSIGNRTFYYCPSLTNVTIGNGVPSIGDETFYGCSNLTSVSIGNGVTSVGSQAFSGCSSLERVDITDLSAWCNIEFDDDYYSPGANPLFYAHNLYLDGQLVTDLVIPSEISSIGDYQFVGCTSITSVTFDKNTTYIGKDSFYNCTNLSSVYCKAVNPPVVGDYGFNMNANGRKIYVPRESVEAYKAKWIYYVDYIEGYDF